MVSGAPIIEILDSFDDRENRMICPQMMSAIAEFCK